ncbi:chaplin [Streptomyces polyrhachis]|uniref:Chaplin n=1 Tax=Streptomyces polyrhachis TaxID=1282885 RepID=A0ABW2GKS7_9ACTN
MKNLKRIAALSLMAGGIAVAGAGVASASGATGAQATGKATGSPGILSGNVVQLPVDVAANVVGNSVNVLGLGNAAFDNEAANR